MRPPSDRGAGTIAMRLRTHAACLALAVIACAPTSNGGSASGDGPELNGVDIAEPLTLQGTEPFWAMRISRDGIRFDRDDIHAVAANPGPTLSANTAIWSTRTADGTAVRAVVTAEKCSDGMGPHDYPLKAHVQYADQTFDGCADTTAALSQPEVASP
jgi:uncharacterized membrane protein